MKKKIITQLFNSCCENYHLMMENITIFDNIQYWPKPTGHLSADTVSVAFLKKYKKIK